MSEQHNDAATHIIMQMNRCQHATQGQVYLPVDAIGKIIADALVLRLEIQDLQEKINRLESRTC